MSYHDKSTSQTSQSSQRNDLGATRPQSRLGSIQPYSRINPPAPNPARPPKRQPDEEAGQRPAVRKPSNVQQAYGEAKRRKTEDEHNPMQPVRPPMAPPIRHSNMRKVSFPSSGHVRLIKEKKKYLLTLNRLTDLDPWTTWVATSIWLVYSPEWTTPAAS